MSTSLANKQLDESKAPEARVCFAQNCRDFKCHISVNVADGSNPMKPTNFWIPFEDAIKLRDNLTRVVDLFWEIKRNDLRYECDEKDAEIARLKRELESLRPKVQNSEVDNAERVSETV